MRYLLSLFNPQTGQAVLVCSILFLHQWFLECLYQIPGGYTFWTRNPMYHRLMGLFNIIFDSAHRERVVKDDLANALYEGK